MLVGMSTLSRMFGVVAAAAVSLATAPAAAQPQGVATFESIGLTWSPSGGSASRIASARYRVAGATAWQDGYPLWFDARDSEYRGSLVALSPGTTYEIETSLAGGATDSTTVTTWPSSFPVGDTVVLPATSSTTLRVTRSGTSSGYIVYTAAAGATATIDVADAQPSCIVVDASYVIIRGLVLRGAGESAIEIVGSAHDVVIEETDISGWGRVLSDGFGADYDAAVYSDSSLVERVVIQRNRIHHPRSSSNSWAQYRDLTMTAHPVGPQAVSFFDTAGNHVIRYNSIYSDDDHRFNDGLGGGENFSTAGFPNRDSDIYGNSISHCWDDGIESEGANRNVRIWGNFIDETYVKIAVASTSVGPAYVFRNVSGTARMNLTEPWDDVEHGGFLKTSDNMGGGRVFVFHNTLLQPAPLTGGMYGRGCDPGLGHGGPIVNLLSRNNILQVHKDWHASIDDSARDPASSYDYDLYNGVITAAAGAEPNGMRGVPIYATTTTAGVFALDPSSPGFDDGQVLANFSDGFAGAGPDVGAFEAGSAPMEFGVDAYRPSAMPGEDGGLVPGPDGSLVADGGTPRRDGSATLDGSTAPPPAGDGGCGCRVAAPPRAHPWALLVAGVGALARFCLRPRRRKRRHLTRA